MPFVNIRFVKEVFEEASAGRVAEKKAEISRVIVEAISEATNLTQEDVWVVFEEVPAAEWYVGPKNVEEIRKARR
jgi:4-oxalocrotonate tautomerase